jgi:hypothetical protein
MATTQRPPRTEKPSRDRTPLLRGFGYLTLDPSPRLRRLREQQQSTDPAMTIRAAWSTVGGAIATAFRLVRENKQHP